MQVDGAKKRARQVGNIWRRGALTSVILRVIESPRPDFGEPWIRAVIRGRQSGLGRIPREAGPPTCCVGAAAIDAAIRTAGPPCSSGHPIGEIKEPSESGPAGGLSITCVRRLTNGAAA